MAQKFVLDTLKAPSTEKFGGETVTALGDDTFEVSGWVDSQNSYGAMIRADFKVKLKSFGSSWKILSGRPELTNRL